MEDTDESLKAELDALRFKLDTAYQTIEELSAYIKKKEADSLDR